MATPATLQSFLHYNSTYRILCCKYATCLHALNPPTAALHFFRKHQLSLALRKAIDAYLNTLENLASGDFNCRPAHGLAAQPHLRIAAGLYQCKRCLVVKSNRLNMRQHVNSLHGLKNFEMEAECSIVYGQTWFPGTKAVWWQVASPVPEVVVGTDGNRTAGLGPSPLQDTLVEELLRVEKEQITAEEQQRWHLQEQHNPDQVSPWLQTTGWLDVFANRSASFADLVQLVRAPSLEETRLQLLAELLNDYIIPRCLDTLRNTPHPYRTWLKSPQEEVDQPKPFMEPQDSRTMKKYTRYWVQYICFIIRSIADHLAESELEDDGFLEVAEPYATLAGLYLTSQQYSCLRQMHCLLLHTADQSMDELEDDVCQKLASRLFQFCLLSVRQQLHLESPYKSSLMYFLAHMGIDAGRNTFREPQTYTSILAGVLYISRLFVLEYTLSASGWPTLNIKAHEGSRAIDHEPVTDETPLEESSMKAFQVERKNWLVQGKNTPIGALLRLLAYGKMVNRMQGRPPAVIWNQSLTSLYFREHPVDIARFKAAVHQIAADASQRLQKLLLGQNCALDLDGILDSLSCEGLWGRTGHNFTHHPANNLGKGLEDMLYRAARQKGGRHLLEETGRPIECAKEPDRQNGQDGQDRSERADRHQEADQRLLKWKSRPCKDYLQLEREFLDLLLIAVHLTGGQPARGPEICSFKHSNGQTSSRNVYVLNGRVAIITQYDKARAIRGKTNYIARYLPAQVSLMLVKYMVWVRPFAIAMERQVAPNFNAQRDGSTTSRSEYLWIGSKDPFSDQYVNRLFKRTMQQYLGLMLNISDYRHIAIAIAREFLQPHCAVLGINAESSLNGGELEGEEEEGNLVLDLQAAHSTRTAELAYAADARFLNKLSGKLLRQFLQASMAWHDWLDMDSESAPFLQTAKRGRSNTSALELPASATAKRLTQLQVVGHGSMRSIAAGHKREEVQTVLRKLHGPHAQFRCRAQAKSVEFLVSCSKSTASIHILGTGQGKSLFFFLLALMVQERGGCVLVIVPYVALLKDLLNRALEKHIQAALWTPEGSIEIRGASLVLASADQTANPRLITYAHRLQAEGELRHIFLDECHVALTDTGYRESLRHLKNLRLVDVPLAALTATLPPCLEEKLRNRLLLSQAHVLRSSTMQKHICYRVQDCGKKQLLPLVLSYINSCQLTTTSTQKGIVFVRSIQYGTLLAKELNCSFYHSQASEKTQIGEQWMSGQQPWLVATGALGTGVNIPEVREVVHVERPYGLINYVQQTGRGGRNCFITTATMFINAASWNPRQSSAQQTVHSMEAVDEEALTQYMQSTSCRRRYLAQYMDGCGEAAETCLSQSVVSCDICQGQQAEAEKANEMNCPDVSQAQADTGSPASPEYSAQQGQFRKQSLTPEEAILSGPTVHAKYQQQLALQQAIRHKALLAYKDCCLYCCVVKDLIVHSHIYSACAFAEKDHKTRLSWPCYLAWRKGLYFSRFQACFDCGLNQEECGRDIVNKEPCSNKDTLFAVVFLTFAMPQLRAELAEKYYSGTMDEKFQKWLLSPCELEEGQIWLVYLFTQYGPFDMEEENELNPSVEGGGLLIGGFV